MERLGCYRHHLWGIDVIVWLAREAGSNGNLRKRGKCGVEVVGICFGYLLPYVLGLSWYWVEVRGCRYLKKDREKQEPWHMRATSGLSMTYIL